MQIVQKWLAQKANQSVLFLLLGGLLFRGIIAWWLYPGFDETYYYLYSINLDWSYFDHPVLVALTTGLGPWLTGEVTQFTIRLGTLILHTGSLGFLYLASAKLFSTKAARLTLAIATIIPMFQIGFGVLTLPDNPLIFFWSASLYCAACEFFPQPSPQEYNLSESDRAQPSTSYRPSYRLTILSILIGLACLGKYHGFLLGFGLICFCLTSPRHRRALLSPWTGLGLGLFFVTIFPILFWNIQHDWVSFRFQLKRGVPREGYNLLSVVGVFLAHIAYLFPTLGLPLWWVSLRSALTQITPLFSKKSLIYRGDFKEKQLLILWVSLPLMLGFTLMGGYQQILPTWPMPGFWGVTLLLGQQAVIWQQQSRRGVRRWLKGSGIVIGTSLLLALLHITTGTLQKSSQYALLGGFVSPDDDPSTELIDIQQLRRGFADSPVLSKALQNSSFIFTNGYYLGGPIGMALTPLFHTPITCFGEDMRGFAFWSRADQWVGKDGLYVTLKRFHRKKDLTAHYRTYFSSLERIGKVPIRRGGEIIEVIYVYQGKTLLKPYPRPYGI
ncbi:MAG TPA: 4-amino-4-deoxy-L-arabinose transferase [Cyanobacteria bacterium UBA8543]|nr:4-amino-4-deoxy-L-arabinose transferase [Cyanobacteria bacterium UBA8543]